MSGHKIVPSTPINVGVGDTVSIKIQETNGEWLYLKMNRQSKVTITQPIDGVVVVVITAVSTTVH